MESRYPALIFDFGNVVAFFDYNRAGDVLGRPIGLDGEAFMKTVRDRGFARVLAEFESGRMAAEPFGREVLAMVDHQLPHDEFVAAFSDIFTLNEPVARLLPQLKSRGHRLVLGSNTNELHAAQFRRDFAEALAPLDAMVLSHEVGAIKPSREFYLACALAAGSHPTDCVFIDDLPENVEGARQAGLQAIVFHDEPTLRRDLNRLGIPLDD